MDSEHENLIPEDSYYNTYTTEGSILIIFLRQ